MNILIISDTHDHVADQQRVINETKGKVDVVIHCGDACAPFMYRTLDGFEVPVHIVLGNCNDKEGAVAKCPDNVTMHGDTAELELDGKKIYVNHYPEIAEEAANKGIYNVVCYGHNHMQSSAVIGKTFFVNPGAVMSEPDIPPGKPGCICYAIYDTVTEKVELFRLN